MKRIISLITVLVMMSAIIVFAQDQGGQQSTKQSQMTQTLCPVMGYEIDRDLYVDYHGKRIYVCCYGCLDIVKADPDKYIKQLESQGLILEKVPVSVDEDRQVQPDADTHSEHQHQKI